LPGIQIVALNLFKVCDKHVIIVKLCPFGVLEILNILLEKFPITLNGLNLGSKGA
jgi:hypothetical protein